MSVLNLKNVGKTYSNAQGAIAALAGIEISADKNEFICIIGPNGCGKSTLLKIIAGIIEPSSGTVESTQSIAYLPQRPGLLPWRTLRQNLSLAQEISGKQDRSTSKRADRLLKEFGLSEFADYYPKALSGGMQQKAALLRTVLSKPDLMLLDEPFSALDAITRVQLQNWLLDLWQRTKPAVVCVTHDIREAIFLADTIYVLGSRPGRAKKMLKVNLKRPRSLAQLHSKEAEKLEKELNKLLAEKI